MAQFQPTRALAAFAANLDVARLPAEVREKLEQSAVGKDIADIFQPEGFSFVGTSENVGMAFIKHNSIAGFELDFHRVGEFHDDAEQRDFDDFSDSHAPAFGETRDFTSTPKRLAAAAAGYVNRASCRKHCRGR